MCDTVVLVGDRQVLFAEVVTAGERDGAEAPWFDRPPAGRAGLRHPTIGSRRERA